MKLIVNLIIDKIIRNEEEIKEYVKNIESYISHVDKLYIYNITKQNLENFYERLIRYDNIECTEMSDYGQVQNYSILLEQAKKENADFSVILELGYYYEEDVFLNLKRYLLEKDHSKIAVLTPMPLLGCQVYERKAEEYRTIKGCKLTGAFINMDIYNKSEGFKLDYYQTTFDYDYCIRQRLQGNFIMLSQNDILRNSNYKILEKKILFFTVSTYDKDLMELYYETRNRYYLWDEFKYLDPEYVKIDQKLFKNEKQEIRYKDKNYREKFEMMDLARADYKKGKKGKYIPSI